MADGARLVMLNQAKQEMGGYSTGQSPGWVNDKMTYSGPQHGGGFRRELKDAVQYSANWSDYLASSAYAHAWMLSHLPAWSEVSFPGFITLTFGVWGAWVTARDRRRELFLLYGSLTWLAFWASFGPTALLYSALYRVVPMFTWLRAPAGPRFDW